MPRKFLIFINPMAGAQKGESVFKQYVKPMLDIAEINYTVEVTSKCSCVRDTVKPPIKDTPKEDKPWTS